MNKYKVVEKFVSIDGEGSRSGFPVVFIRFANCNLDCPYCDTQYANKEPKYEVMTEKQIVAYITLTGFKTIFNHSSLVYLYFFIYFLINNRKVSLPSIQRQPHSLCY